MKKSFAFYHGNLSFSNKESDLWTKLKYGCWEDDTLAEKRKSKYTLIDIDCIISKTIIKLNNYISERPF